MRYKISRCHSMTTYEHDNKTNTNTLKPTTNTFICMNTISENVRPRSVDFDCDVMVCFTITILGTSHQV